jgi:hypothetical protein
MIVSQAWEGSFVWLLIKQPDYNASLSNLKPLPSSPIILSHAPLLPTYCVPSITEIELVALLLTAKLRPEKLIGVVIKRNAQDLRQPDMVDKGGCGFKTETGEEYDTS